MSKKMMIITTVVVIVIIASGGIYYATSNKNNSTTPSNDSTTTTTNVASTKPTLQGNAEVQAVLNKVKASTPTVTAIRVYTETTDPNNELGKTNQYQYAG